MDSGADSILRLRLIPYNARLTSARRNAGFSQKDMSLMTGINATKMSDIETLKVIATDFEKGEISSALSTSVKYLFPKELELSISVGVFDEREKHLSSPQVEALAMSYTDKGIERFEELYKLKETLAEALTALTPRERKIVELRFGLDIGTPHTLEDVGARFNFTRERVRQIESKALRKIRHPRNSRNLRPFLDEAQMRKQETYDRQRTQ